jgi:hypothetical protein
MKRSSYHRRIWFGCPAFLLGAWLCMLSSMVEAQTVTTITANPKAQRLHEIWRVRGTATQASVGEGANGVGDINGDSINDFAVRFPYDGGWKLFYGKAPTPSTTPAWQALSYGVRPDIIVSGDFWGTGHRAVGITRDTCNPNNGVCLFRLALFRSESNQLDSTPSAVLDSKQQFCLRDAIAADLDGDGIDELILSRACDYPEIWIYRGGPNFQVDSPSVVIRDTQRVGIDQFFRIAAGDFDHDGFIDLITGTHRRNAPQQITFFFGSPGSPWNWSHPDRTISLDSTTHPQVALDLGWLDCDGDRALDIILSASSGTYFLFRTHNTWKSPRTRPFTFDDADFVFSMPGLGAPVALPTLNDSTHRFQMIGLLGLLNGKPTMVAISGGPDGPNGSYEAFFDNDLGNVFGIVRDLGDVSGDGWPDLLCANSSWYAFNQGIALIVSGGPYIPRDSATSSVRDIELESHVNALSVWPMPARDVLNIAWRGDLKQMPHRFEVHDMAGRLVAEGEVDASAGSAVWRCGDAPAGAYLLSVFDHDDRLITTTSFVKL